MKNRLLLLLFGFTFSSIIAQDVPKNWFLMDRSEGYDGISADKAYADILKDAKGETVVVAIIDSGIDIQHEDLKDNIWINLDEIPDNGKDDDGNGYIDDVYGWNFIGGPDGKNVGPDTYEVTRIFGKYDYKYKNADPSKLSGDDKKEYALYLKAKEEVEKARDKASSQIAELDKISERINSSLDMLSEKLGDNSLTIANVEKVEDTSPEISVAKQVALEYLSKDGVNTMSDIKSAIQTDIDSDKKRYQDQLDYAYNTDFDTRALIVKDNYADATQSNYGNNDVEGPDPLHGTHVAGIVGAVADNGIGMNGVAKNVKLMSVRTVPDGDERDKDVANAIRYAVDNGASIINMSFGKAYSWNKGVVNDAVKYAAKHDVLMVHAAGNSAKNTDVEDNFPNDLIKEKGFFLCPKKEAKNWIEVGALNFEKGEKAVARFSNYGQDEVDLFSPGVKIYSTMPNDEYAFLQGTSMASPVVAGVAAVIRSYFPTLTAEQVKEAIMESVVPIDGMVDVPGKKDTKQDFKELSVTGGEVNLYNAILAAAKMKGKKKIDKKKIGA
ncbi:MAG TPA: S8 family serine peptidase [Saprospiraceae bacterium]|nr:S8 family serine peptidase [Saprospiraceae bacterium]MCB9328191.1 S8 family serine peptidase [Lewinellaceae bacterium]HRX29224.1 S8 family serine peptidase [Saprospiraceae bacterium]